jgi:hypothetical protein
MLVKRFLKSISLKKYLPTQISHSIEAKVNLGAKTYICRNPKSQILNPKSQIVAKIPNRC